MEGRRSLLVPSFIWSCVRSSGEWPQGWNNCRRLAHRPTPRLRTGLCFRESEVKAYADASKSWPPHFVRVWWTVSCYAVCPRLVVVSCRGLSACFTIVPGWAHSLSRGFAWWVSAVEDCDGQRASPQSSIAGWACTECVASAGPPAVPARRP